MVDFPEENEPSLTKDSQFDSFTALIKASKKNPWDTTQGKVFAVIQGEFETRLVGKGKDAHLEGYGFGVTASIPSRLILKRVLCSASILETTHSETEALSQCQGRVGHS